jgi:hypothetical protein
MKITDTSDIGSSPEQSSAFNGKSSGTIAGEGSAFFMLAGSAGATNTR